MNTFSVMPSEGLMPVFNSPDEEQVLDKKTFSDDDRENFDAVFSLMQKTGFMSEPLLEEGVQEKLSFLDAEKKDPFLVEEKGSDKSLEVLLPRMENLPAQLFFEKNKDQVDVEVSLKEKDGMPFFLESEKKDQGIKKEGQAEKKSFHSIMPQFGLWKPLPLDGSSKDVIEYENKEAFSLSLDKDLKGLKKDGFLWLENKDVMEENFFPAVEVEAFSIQKKETPLKMPTHDFLSLKKLCEHQEKPIVLEGVPLKKGEKKEKMPMDLEIGSVEKKEKKSVVKEEEKSLWDAETSKAFISKDRAFPSLNLQAAALPVEKMPLKNETVMHPAFKVPFEILPHLVLQGKEQVTFQLNPQHLGGLQIEIKRSGKEVELVLKADKKETEQLLKENIGFLKESLALKEWKLVDTQIVFQKMEDPKGPLPMSIASEGAYAWNSHFQDKGAKKHPDFFEEESFLSIKPRQKKARFFQPMAASSGINILAE